MCIRTYTHIFRYMMNLWPVHLYFHLFSCLIITRFCLTCAKDIQNLRQSDQDKTRLYVMIKLL